MPDDVAARGWVDAASHEATKTAWPKNESNGHDNGGDPMKSSAQGVVMCGGLLCHSVLVELAAIVQTLY